MPRLLLDPHPEWRSVPYRFTLDRLVFPRTTMHFVYVERSTLSTMYLRSTHSVVNVLVVF